MDPSELDQLRQIIKNDQAEAAKEEQQSAHKRFATELGDLRQQLIAQGFSYPAAEAIVMHHVELQMHLLFLKEMRKE